MTEESIWMNIKTDLAREKGGVCKTVYEALKRTEKDELLKQRYAEKLAYLGQT